MTALVTWNPSDKGGSVVLSNGNLTATCNFLQVVRATHGHNSGLHQFEVTVNAVNLPNAPIIGVATLLAVLSNYLGSDNNGWSAYGVPAPAQKIHGSASSNYGAEILVGDILTVLVDSDLGIITTKLNGVSQGVMFNTGLAGLMLYPAVSAASSGATTEVYTANFGATALAFPEAGYTNWNVVDASTPAYGGPLPVFQMGALGDDYIAAYGGPLNLFQFNALGDDYQAGYSGPLPLIQLGVLGDDYQAGYSGPLSIIVLGPHGDDYQAGYSGPLALNRTTQVIRIADGAAKAANAVTPPYSFPVTLVNALDAGATLNVVIEHYRAGFSPGVGSPYATTNFTVNGPKLAGAALGTLSVDANGVPSFA